MELNVKNLSRTLLTQDIGLTETSFEVADAGALPDPPFLITVEGEIMRVGSKNVSTNTLSNVLRGREGTSPAPHSSGTVVENRFTAGTYDEIKQTVTSCNDALTSHLAETASINAIGHVYAAEFTATLSTSWSGSAAPYTQTVTINGITSAHNPIIDVMMSGTYSTDQQRIEQWGYIYRAVTGNDSITFYATEKPTVSLPIQIKVVR